MKIKVDKYKMFCKKRQREFEVLVFEPPKYMWAFDDYPERDMMMIDGSKDAFKVLKYAYAILAQDPSKIIYFPIANDGIGIYYNQCSDLVLVRPELQFRYSDWYKIKPKLDKKHKVECYTYNYNKQKLIDYYYVLKNDWFRADIEKREQKIYCEKILGDTVFMTVPECRCYENHKDIVKMMSKYENGKPDFWLQGWLVPDNSIKKMIEEAEENKS